MTALRNPVVKEVPSEWEAQLAEFSPPTNRFTYLHLLWEAGYPWEPVERYMIYQMTPAHAMTEGLMDAVLEQLQDPHPPSQHDNYYDTALEEFVRNPDCLITERAWHLFRETNCWGRPYWVIQGTKGGHKRWFSQNEQKLLKMAGLPTTPPAPGDLPYAEFDDRVMVQLEKLDMLRSEQGQLKRRGSILGKNAHQIREEEDGKKFRQQLVAFLKEQMEEIGPDVHKGLIGIDAARSKEDPRKLEEALELAEHDFIETGNSKASLLRLER